MFTVRNHGAASRSIKEGAWFQSTAPLPLNADHNSSFLSTPESDPPATTGKFMKCLTQAPVRLDHGHEAARRAQKSSYVPDGTGSTILVQAIETTRVGHHQVEGVRPRAFSQFFEREAIERDAVLQTVLSDALGCGEQQLVRGVGGDHPVALPRDVHRIRGLSGVQLKNMHTRIAQQQVKIVPHSPPLHQADAAVDELSVVHRGIAAMNRFHGSKH